MDLYSAGCVLFELSAVTRPSSATARCRSPTSTCERTPRRRRRSTRRSADIDAVVIKALAKNPANRYQSAAEMRADLLRAAAGRPVLATPVLRDAETAMLDSAGASLGAPARVGDPERRKASTWVLASLAALGVLRRRSLSSWVC